ncbi:MAG: hypothetical protein ACPLN0_04470 [Candidatus Hydrothermia bacterium]
MSSSVIVDEAFVAQGADIIQREKARVYLSTESCKRYIHSAGKG